MVSEHPMLDSIHIRLLTYHFIALKPPWWRIQNIQSTFWRFYMNNRDGAFLEQGSGSYPFQPGRLYFIPAGVRFTTNLKQDVGHLYVHFDLIGLPHLVRREIFSHVIGLPPMPVLEKTVWELMGELERHEGVELIQQFRVKAILYEGLTRHLEQMPEEDLQRCLRLTSTMEPVLPAVQHIEINLASPLPNTDLANLCHMNTDYFIRRFRECMGQTPGQYIQEQRVKRAEQQILLTNQSIEQIATNNGFGSRFYFTRVFTQHTGVSPAAYRKGLCGD